MASSNTTKQQLEDDEKGSNGNNTNAAPAFVTTVAENDVLLGRGAPVIQNIGNTKFRALVQTRKQEYTRAQRHNAKDAIARQIVQEITTNRGGKFLRRVATLAERKKLGAPENAAVWAVVDNGTALEKTKQTLREKDHPRSGDRKAENEGKQSISAAPDSALAQTLSEKLNWGTVSGTGLHHIDASLRSNPGLRTPAVDQLELLMMQQQLPGLFGNDSLALPRTNFQQSSFPRQFLSQTHPFRQSTDDQLALLMLQRHRAARAARLQQQLASLQAEQASLQQHRLGLLPTMNPALQLSLLQQQQIGLGNSSLFPLGQGFSQLGGTFATAGLHVARPSPQQQGIDGIDPGYLSFLQHQKEMQSSVSATTGAAGAAGAEPLGTALEQQDVGKLKRAKLQSVALKRKSNDDNASNESARSSISNSSRSSVEYSKPVAPKKPKP